MNSELVVNNIGINISFSIPENLTGQIISARIFYIKPNKESGEWPASISYNDSETIIYKQLSAGDIDMPGVWKFECSITTSNGQAINGKIAYVFVEDRIH